MRLDLVQCLVQIPDGGGSGFTQVLKAGPGAVTPPEMAILQYLHNTEAEGPARECLSRCRVVGFIETDAYNEIDRLAGIYKKKMVSFIFPPQSKLPQTLDDLNLPEECMDPQGPVLVEEEGKEILDPSTKLKPKTAKQLRAGLEAMGIDVPVGNISIADLTALFPQAA